ncbi:hypothetical protein NS14008_18680 [Nocardia seriolae]|nr:hypothetical protein NS14008_18680 [Nocardia seriolae]PSK27854.1 hypothetical protein C6575_29565 [Nocardia seriolae]RLP27496.1 hypothetical protein D6158_29180 [Nocardia seriolae]BAW06963.1 conserved hypothetical protein [Nocardia seriolae]
MIDAAAARTQFARPATPAPAPREHSGPAAVWQEARTVLVTRTTGPRQLVTVPRLVVPIGDNGLAFRASSYSVEAEQLAEDGRVLVQPGDWRGNPKVGSRQLQGQARLISTGTFVPRVQAELEAKYRWRTSLARMAHRMANGSAPYGNLVVLVTVFEPGPLALPY